MSASMSRSTASSPQQRTIVLSLYKRLLRLSQSWVGRSQEDTPKERLYIREETRTLFRQNKNLEDSRAVMDAVQEGEARLEIALHYRTPYPRPVNLPPKALARRQGKEQGAVQERLKKQSRPLYIKSLDQAQQPTSHSPER